MRRLFFYLLVLLHGPSAISQVKLQPGFDAKEYAELLSLTFFSSSIADSVQRLHTKDPYRMEYRSPELGLLNRWTLYLRTDNVAVIDLRGTVNKPESWLENFYAAAIDATGSLQITDSAAFSYQLSENPRAQVHAGWTLGLAHLAPDIRSRINKYYAAKKVTQFLIFGHSQGGALAYLLRSWLHYEQQKNNIPADVVFKTYCSAAPKPGNLYYAYDFDYITRGGWAHTVVNAADWVPETPFSIQTLKDFNISNPLTNAKATIRKQKFFMRLALNSIYNKLDRSTRKAQRRFEKYLGRMIYKPIRRTLPQFRQPDYAPGNNFMRAGIPVILMPDEAYMKDFPDSPATSFIHHTYKSYAALLERIYQAGSRP